MDNPSRSERTRNAALQAALTIIARDGPGRLTLDAIAKESGISKGGLMHQFPTKVAVLKALMEHQIDYFDKFARKYAAEHGAGQAEPQLAMHIATLREVVSTPHSVAFAILGAAAQEPSLLSLTRETDAKIVERIRTEAADPDLAMMRWAAALGLALTTLFGMSPLSEQERSRLFDFVADDRNWSRPSGERKSAPAPARPKAKPRSPA
ncbi:MAG: TetR/AcrR family transcriptional regulator [Proteobacteria bacterium]|nr:TetR/AcrR family transcriptional regulator [Pseudomonadota bacterium]